VTGNDDINEINIVGSFTIGPKDSDVGGCFRPITFTDSGLSFPFYGFTFSSIFAEAGTELPKLYSNRISLSGFIDPGWSVLGMGEGTDVSCSVSSEEIEFGGGISLPDITIGGFGINRAFLKLADDPDGWSWGAGVSFGFPDYLCGGFEIGALLGILNGDLNELLIKIKKFPKPPGNLPIVNTGVFLKSLEGGLMHIASADTHPVVLHAGAGFCAGPTISVPGIELFGGSLIIGGGDLFLLGGDVDLDLDFGGKVTAEGNAYILADNIGKIGNAGLTIDINKGLYLRGGVQYPPGFNIINGEIAGKLDLDLEFQASMEGIAQIPECLPIIGGYTFGDAIGYIDNDLIAVGVSVDWLISSYDVCTMFYFNNPGFSVASNWDAIQEVTLTSTPLFFQASRIEAPLVYAGLGMPPLGQSHTSYAISSTARANPAVGQVLPEGLEVVIFYMKMSSEGIPPNFIVTAPGGVEYDERSTEVFWRRNDAAGDLWCAVPNPKAGKWTVTPDDSLRGSEYKIAIYQLNEKPTLKITLPKGNIDVEAGNNVVISWNAEDPDDEAMIRLCYSDSQLQLGNSNLPAWPGNTIVKNISEENLKSTYNWDTTGVAPGKYYIYGVITDGKNFPVFAWSEGSVTVQRNDFLPLKKEDVHAYQDGSLVQVEWDSVPGATGYHVYYQNVNRNAPLSVAVSQAVWEDMAKKAKCLLEEERPSDISQAVWEYIWLFRKRCGKIQIPNYGTWNME
jgi:hypothetical protein